MLKKENRIQTHFEKYKNQKIIEKFYLKKQFKMVNRLCKLCSSNMNTIAGEAGIKNPMELIMEINVILIELLSGYSNLKVK